VKNANAMILQLSILVSVQFRVFQKVAWVYVLRHVVATGIAEATKNVVPTDAVMFAWQLLQNQRLSLDSVQL
ncbi:hypothetical protein, partial [Salmonella sp. s51884]|uniref:hypothetical protein n=1 Tax=Salmonella sp. s51884 TaxID=3159654 RepID=UPI00398068B9